MIRELAPKDAEAFRTLRRAAVMQNEGGFATAIDEWISKSLTEISEILADEFASPNDFILGAFDNHQLVGMIGFFRPARPKLERHGHIWGMFLLPEHRGQGTAGKLLDELIKRAKQMHGIEQIQLTTLNQYKSSILLYKSRGFRVFATEKAAVKLGEYVYDELYMLLSLA
ncbi:MAG: GNAT family N-acetyltransferase [Chloroflexota bacterium]